MLLFCVLRFRVLGLGFRVLLFCVLRFRVLGLGYRVLFLWFKVQGLGFWV